MGFLVLVGGCLAAMVLGWLVTELDKKNGRKW